MLDSATIKKINETVYIKPRTIQEIALLINKNWRTAERYVNKIAEEQGTIATRTFREGTKGGLKIVYWCNIEKIHSTTFQEKLYERIKIGKDKLDFSPFDIFQYVDENKRNATAYSESSDFKNHKIANILHECNNQLLSFSGNLSWLSIPHVLDSIEILVKNNVTIKILTKIDITSIGNINKLTEIEEKLGKKMIEIRHCEQPLRGLVIDCKVARFIEIKKPEEYDEGELKERLTIFYDITDEEWVAWLQKVFFNLFSTSIDYRKRLNDLKFLHNLNS